MKRPLKVKHLEFDHAFTDDHQHRFFTSLANAGFSLSPKTVHHPGGAVCRFLHVDQANRGRKHSYFEFVHVKGGKYEGITGLSLRPTKGLEAYFAKVAGNVLLAPTLEHRNYDWQKGGEERRPGWNFVMFHKKTPKQCFVWLTEYEVSDERPKVRKPTTHKVGAIRVAALRFELAEKDRAFFTALFGAPFSDQVVLNCGTLIHFSAGKRTQLKELVISVNDLNKVNRAEHRFTLATFLGRPALSITNPNLKMWSLLLVQAE